MTLNQLRILVAIADAGFNITHAAERVHATQPGLSKQLRQLEDYLGLVLFVRRGKSLLGLTAAGEPIVARARAILAEVRGIREVAANARNAERGELRIATVHTQARYTLPLALAELRRRLPDVSIRLEPGEHEDVLGQLARGEVDLGILNTSGDAPEGVTAIPASHWHRVALVPREHPLARKPGRITLRDLAAHPLVTYRSARGHESSLARAFAAQGLAPNIACTASDADVIKAHVRAGIGVGLVAAVAVDAADRDDLVELDVSLLLPRCTTWIVLRRADVVPRYVQEFIALFAPHVGAQQLRALQAAPHAGGHIVAPVWSRPLARAALAAIA